MDLGLFDQLLGNGSSVVVWGRMFYVTTCANLMSAPVIFVTCSESASEKRWSCLALSARRELGENMGTRRGRGKGRVCEVVSMTGVDEVLMGVLPAATAAYRLSTGLCPSITLRRGGHRLVVR